MRNSIIKRLPKYYRKSLVMWRITDAEEDVLKDFAHAADEFDKELYVDTAERELDRFESDLRLKKPLPIPRQGSPEYNDWLNLRRSNIRAKKHGYGICLESMLIMIAENYTDGKVSIDRSRYNDYKIVLVFNKIGIPRYLSEILAAVSEVKPAHMLLDYEVRKRTWEEVLSAQNMWEDVINHNWNDVMHKEDILDD